MFLKSPGPVHKHMHFDLIKMHPKIFFHKNVDFYIFESQKYKRNENYPETLLNFGPLKCSRLGQKFIQYYWCLSQKKEFVKCSFISLLKCILSRVLYPDQYILWCLCYFPWAAIIKCMSSWSPLIFAQILPRIFLWLQNMNLGGNI